MTLQSSLLAVLFASTSWSIAGCAPEGEGVSEASQRFEMVTVCAETICQARHARAREQCNECLSIAESSCLSHSLACNTAAACRSSCSGTTCTEASPPLCNKKGFAPKYPDRDEALFVVFEQMDERGRACRPNNSTPSRSDHNARILRSDRMPGFKCVLALGCDATDDDYGKCYGESTSIFGSEICATRADRGNPCGKGQEAALNAFAGFLRDDVLQAARDCVALEDPGEASECFSAWERSLNPR